MGQGKTAPGGVVGAGHSRHSHQFALQELGDGFVYAELVGVAHEVVRVVDHYHHFHRYVRAFEAADEVDRLVEADVAVVVAMDEEDWGFPARDIGYGRGFEGRFRGFFEVGDLLKAVLGEAHAALLGPVVDSVDVDAGGEEAGVLCQGHGREKSAIGAAVDADAGGVHLGLFGEPLAAGFDVLVFRSTGGAAVGRALEIVTVADA